MFTASKLIWFLLEPSNSLVLLVILGGALCWTRFARVGRKLTVFSGISLFLVGILPIGTFLLAPLENRFPAFVDDGKPVHGVVVLGGALMSGVALARGTIEFNEAGERILALVTLARRYPDARIVFTGGAGDITGNAASEADVLEKLLPEFFAETLEKSRILYERMSRNTQENASLARVLVNPHSDERWLLVTSAWHMPRSVGLFRKAGWNVTPYPVDFRTAGNGDDWRPFASVARGLLRLDLATKEWAGLVFARISGRSSALFPG